MTFMICTTTNYYTGDEIETIEMGEVCGTYGREESRIQSFGGET